MSYATMLREKAHTCGFGESLDDRILEHLLQTIENKFLIQKCTKICWTLSDFLTQARLTEDIALQTISMIKTSHEYKIARIDRRVCDNTSDALPPLQIYMVPS